MREYDDTTYGDRISEAYDAFYSDYDPASIELLAELAGTKTQLRFHQSF